MSPGRHALIDFQAGAYYLIDTSHNGVFIQRSRSSPSAVVTRSEFSTATRLRFRRIRNLGDKSSEEENDISDDGMGDSVVRAQLVPEDESVEIQMVDEGHVSLTRKTWTATCRPAEMSARHSSAQ